MSNAIETIKAAVKYSRREKPAENMTRAIACFAEIYGWTKENAAEKFVAHCLVGAEAWKQDPCNRYCLPEANDASNIALYIDNQAAADILAARANQQPKMGGREKMTKTRRIKQAVNELKSLGAPVFERMDIDLFGISAESNYDNCWADYYMKFGIHRDSEVPGVDPRICAIVKKYDFHLEWEDPGALIVYDNRA